MRITSVTGTLQRRELHRRSSRRQPARYNGLPGAVRELPRSSIVLRQAGPRSRGHVLQCYSHRRLVVPHTCIITIAEPFCVGGENNQTLSEAGAEANLDVQYGFGITFPTPGIFWSTGGSPPFTPDQQTPTDSNEPYETVRCLFYGVACETCLTYVVVARVCPCTGLRTADHLDELRRRRADRCVNLYTVVYLNELKSVCTLVPIAYAQRVCADFAQLGASSRWHVSVRPLTYPFLPGARGVSLLFGSGDGGVGDGDNNPATSTDCVTNDGTNTPTFLPLFPASCPL